METFAKIANLSDWDKLLNFYKKIYKPGHPLQNLEFWKWQYGNPDYGNAYIVADDEKVYGHVGASFVDGYAWMINVYMNETLRGQGWVGKLYNMARQAGYPLAATSANVAGLGLYRKMNWIRYTNLERWIIIHPDYINKPTNEILKPVSLIDLKQADNHYYWQQPGIKGVVLDDGTTANAQENVGGLRLVNAVNLKQAVEQAWALGFTWCDYVSSWNDPIHDVLPKQGWMHQANTTFPWYLSPIDESKKFAVSFLSEECIDKRFIVKRYHSDHGRVGSL